MIKSRLELRYVIPKLILFPLHNAASASSNVTWICPNYSRG